MKIVELIIPKMGESINEVKILNWLKKEGDLDLFTFVNMSQYDIIQFLCFR